MAPGSPLDDPVRGLGPCFFLPRMLQSGASFYRILSVASDAPVCGLCYGKEFGEDMLSRLGSLKDRYTWAVTPSGVEDLFVQICPARMNRRLLVIRLSFDIETEIRQGLHSYVTDDRLRLPYCPWRSGTSTMERHWEADLDFLSDRYGEPDMDTFTTLLTDVLRTFLRQPRKFSPALLRLMDKKVPLRSVT